MTDQQREFTEDEARRMWAWLDEIKHNLTGERWKSHSLPEDVIANIYIRTNMVLQEIEAREVAE